MFIPGQERYTVMSPQEFEKYCLTLLQKEAVRFGNGTFEHNVMLKAHDGAYQIDGKINFTYLGLSFTCLVECKRYKGPVKREQISVLHSKMQSLGAQKGIFITTSYYQIGAIQFAQEYGIALLTITDEGLTYQTRSSYVNESIYPVADSSKYVSVLTEAISDTEYRNCYLYDESCDMLHEYLIREI